MEGGGGASRLRLGVGRDAFRHVQYRMCSRRGAYALPKQIVQGDPGWGAWLQSPEGGLLWALFLLN